MLRRVQLVLVVASTLIGCGDSNPFLGKWALIDTRTALTCPSTLEVTEKLWRTNDGAQTYTYTKDGDSYIFTYPNARAPMIVKLGSDKTITLEAGLFKCQLRRTG